MRSKRAIAYGSPLFAYQHFCERASHRWRREGRVVRYPEFHLGRALHSKCAHSRHRLARQR
jgi:hypothetical protein